MNHRLLILGTLGEFVQLVQKAKQKGYYTIVCDGYPNGEARAYADASYVLPVTDTDAIAELCKKEKIDGIITSFSDLLMECMVKIAAKADLPCYLKPEQLPWYRDKSVCRQTLSELGLPTPGYVKIPVSLSGEPDKIKQLVQNLSYPLISKPMDKYGSRGIYIIYDERELAAQVTRTAEFTDLEEVLVEEYNDGFEFNMMTWVNDGKVNVISIADRQICFQSVREMLIRPGFFRMFMSLRGMCFSLISHTRVRWTDRFRCSFSGSRVKVFRSARSQQDFLDMNMN